MNRSSISIDLTRFFPLWRCDDVEQWRCRCRGVHRFVLPPIPPGVAAAPHRDERPVRGGPLR